MYFKLLKKQQHVRSVSYLINKHMQVKIIKIWSQVCGLFVNDLITTTFD